MNDAIIPTPHVNIVIQTSDAATVEAVAGAVAATMGEGGWKLINHTPGVFGTESVVLLAFGLANGEKGEVAA